jgi:plasmid maintenance system killer protein
VRLFGDLPQSVQDQAHEAYERWKVDPRHSSSKFKKLRTRRDDVYSVRIGLGWRALGTLEGDTMVWLWIGPHSEYDRLLRQL